MKNMCNLTYQRKEGKVEKQYSVILPIILLNCFRITVLDLGQAVQKQAQMLLNKSHSLSGAQFHLSDA